MAHIFLMKQYRYIQLYLITLIEKQEIYGLQVKSFIDKDFRMLSFNPDHSQIYRALYSLVDIGVVERREETDPGDRYKKVYLYRIRDKQMADVVKNNIKKDLDRSMLMLQKALKDNFGY